MVEIRKYTIKPTALMPNSPLPLIHYVGFLDPKQQHPGPVYDLFKSNGWIVQWLFRYGHTQRAHYHSAAHEAMAVLTGTAKIRFGVADTMSDMEENTHGSAWEEGGVEVEAKPGDVFIIPAGVSHKTYNTLPEAELKLLSPGTGHELVQGDMSKAFHAIELSGFTMLGAYPVGHTWDFLEGGEHEGRFAEVWKLPKPDTDPVFGKDKRGILGIWDSPAQAGGSKL